MSARTAVMAFNAADSIFNSFATREVFMASHVRTHPVSAAFAAPGFLATLGGFGRQLWNGLSAIGEARARRELLQLAARTTDPQLAAHLRQVVAEDWLTRG